MRFSRVPLVFAILSYIPSINAQIPIGAIGALLSDVGAIAGGLGGGATTITVTSPQQQTGRPGNPQNPIQTPTQPPIMAPPISRPGGTAPLRTPTPLPFPGQGTAPIRNPTPLPFPGQGTAPNRNPTPLPGQGRGTAPPNSAGASFPIFTGPAKISTMIQRVASIESVAATATGEAKTRLMNEASVLRVAAEAAMASATMMSENAAATARPLPGWGVAAVGVGLLLI